MMRLSSVMVIKHAWQGIHLVADLTFILMLCWHHFFLLTQVCFTTALCGAYANVVLICRTIAGTLCVILMKYPGSGCIPADCGGCSMIELLSRAYVEIYVYFVVWCDVMWGLCRDVVTGCSYITSHNKMLFVYMTTKMPLIPYEFHLSVECTFVILLTSNIPMHISLLIQLQIVQILSFIMCCLLITI